MRPTNLVPVLLLTSALAAQVPDGFCVVSSFHYGSGSSNFGGLFLVHPRTPGPAIPIAGLGADLVGAANLTQGANCVSVRSDDGMVIVGEVGPAGTNIDLHEVFLNGTTVAVDLTTPVGVVDVNAPNGAGGINQIAVLPNGDLVFGTHGLSAQPPLNGSPLGYFDRATRTVSPIPLANSALTACNALTVDRAGTEIYAALYAPPLSGHLYRLPITGGAGTQLVPGGSMSGLAVASTGHIIASTFTSVIDINPATGQQVTVAPIGSIINGVFLERATDAPFAALNGLGSGGPGFFRVNGNTSQLLTTTIPGVPSGIAVYDTPREYGAATPGGATYGFAVGPTIGGLPFAGNSQFAIRVNAMGPTPGLGVLVANFAPAQQQIFGVDVLVDPTNAVSLGFFAPGAAVPFPIPAGFPAFRFYLQSFHFDAGAPQGVAATPGLVLGTIQ